MKCKICGAESGRYPLCRSCNIKKETGEVFKCEKCGMWHFVNQPCDTQPPIIDDEEYLYEVKKSLITKSEQGFFDAIKSAIPEGYCVFPQINLASFINRTDDARFQNELFRNVDFLITDAAYSPKIVVEINDQSHFSPDRKERDEKVQKICEEAGIPLLKFWTSYGINIGYIKGRIEETLNSIPVARAHHFEQLPPPAKPLYFSRPRRRRYIRRKKGCYVATCVYGSYDCPEVWVLRRYRDNTLDNSFWGRLFIKIYYTISPLLVSLFGRKKWFVAPCKLLLDRLVCKLQSKGFENTFYNDKY